MKCVICKVGETKPGTTTVTLEREGVVLVFKKTPARVCSNCGEAYVDGDISERILSEAALRAGVQVDVRDFAVATA
jgi:YgiT-type zinc finger domain-containing protein